MTKKKVFPKERKRAVRTNHVAFAKMIAAMFTTKHLSVNEIQEACGLHKLTVGDFLRTMRNNGAARRSDWGFDRLGRANIPLWSLGKGPDKPQPKTDKFEANRKRNRAYRARIKQAKLLGMTYQPRVYNKRKDSNEHGQSAHPA